MTYADSPAIPARKSVTLRSGAGLFAILVYLLTLVNHQNRPAPADGILSEGMCTDLGAATFCHDLQLLDIDRTRIPKPRGEAGPQKISIGFDFKGWRSCRVGKETISVDFKVTMGGVSAEVAADYPALIAAVAPSPAELKLYQPGARPSIIIDPMDGGEVDLPMLSTVFGIEGGTLFHHGVYITRYTPIAESKSACQAFGENYNG